MDELSRSARKRRIWSLCRRRSPHRIWLVAGVPASCRQQKAIGNNLNQLAVLANMGKVQFANLDAAAREFAKLLLSVVSGKATSFAR